MKERILKSILVSLLIILLISLDFILLGYNIVTAVSNSVVAATNIENVDFDVYFIQDGTKVYEKSGDVNSEDTIILHIEVDNNGELSDAKIQMSNVNFKILKGKVQNSYVKEIDDETNEITLNPIIYGNSVDIEIPIQFKKQEVFNENYFTQENIINFSGSYRSDSQQTVTSEKSLKINWTGDIDVILTQNVSKFIGLGEDGILLQQNITSDVQENTLPREQEILNINVPVILDQKPNDIYVILNEKRVEEEKVKYDKDNNLLEIKISNEEANYTWGEAQNSYQVIYVYPKEIGEDDKQIEINTTLKTKLFTKDEIQKQDIQNVEISKTGNVVDLQKSILAQEIYKGYLYAKTQNEVTFEEEENVNISYSNNINSMQIETLENQFENEENQEFVAGSSVSYKGFAINKQHMLDVLGEAGSITIQDENGAIVAIINSSTEADENGNINITYDGNKKNVKVITSKPLTEGSFKFKHIKSISGMNDYTKEQMKTFSKLISRSKVVVATGEVFGESTIILQDTKTEAKLEMSNTSLSILQENSDIQFLVTLISNNEQYDLYKNPSIQIVLPKELNIEIKKITQLNGQEELSIVNAELIHNDDETKTILLYLQGEQLSFKSNISEGIQISITADITIEKTVPSMSSQIVMNYSNENREGENFSYQLPITLNSKYGVLLINKLSDYNLNGDVLENIDDKLKEVMLDVNSDGRTANQNISIVNNYETDITDISLIGKLPDIGEETINNEELKATFSMELLNNIQTSGEAVKIFYSEDVNADKDSQTWVENVDDFSDVKAFKVEVEDNKLEAGSVLGVSTQLDIPESLGYEQSTYMPLTLNYEYNGDIKNSISLIELKTKSEEKEVVENNSEQISVQVTAESGPNRLEAGQEVIEGQAITYNVILANNGEEDLSNIKLEANNTNVIFYDEIKYVYDDGEDGENELEEEETILTKIDENPDLQSKIFDIELLKAGESIELEYQVSVKENTANQKVEGNINIKNEILDENIELMEFQIVEGMLKLKVQNQYAEETPIYSRESLPIQLDVKNISEQVLNNVMVEVPIPEEWSFLVDNMGIEQTDKCEYINYEDGVVRYRINEISPDETINIYIKLIANSIPLDTLKIDTAIYYRAYYGEYEYLSNTIKKEINQLEGSIYFDYTSDVVGDVVKDGDIITYTATIRNEGIIQQYLSINSIISNNAVIEEAYITSSNGDSVQNLEVYDNTALYVSYELQEGEEINIVVKARVNSEFINSNRIVNTIQVSGVYIDESAEIIHLIEGLEDEETYYSIDGTAWVDENENGTKESFEEKLSNINVMLINEETGEIHRDSDGNAMETVTNDYGEYRFDNVVNGNYIVAFGYDSTRYIVTEYQKDGVSSSLNSDVISRTVSVAGREMQVATTKTLNLITEDLNDIDAGFIEADEFDLKLDKYINKVIVQDSTGTRVEEFDKAQLAKIEIDARRTYNTTITIEYQIQVTNEGDVPGYVNEIIDYMPSDLEFNSEINKSWYQGTDGYLHTTQLSDQIINPGETKQVDLVLVKNITPNNLGTIINVAEIGRDNNNLSIQDKDSTAGNRVNGEDDISTAEIIVSIRTGTVVMYVGLVFTIFIIIITGIYFINKKVLVKEDDDFIL